VKIKDISGISFSSRGSSQQQGHLSICNGLFGEIIIDDQAMSSSVSEIFSDSTGGIGGQELKRGGFRGGGGDDNSVFHGLVVSESLDDIGDGGSLLSNGDINAVELFVSVSSVEIFLLIQDGINGDGGLSGLSVSNNEFSLSSTDGDQTIDGFESGLHGLVDGFSGDNTGGFDFHSVSLGGLDGSQSVDGVTQGIEDSSEHFFSDGNIHDGSGSTNDISFLNESIVSEDHDSDVVGFEIQGHSTDSRGEFNHLSSLDLAETENSGNTISNGDNGTVFFNIIELRDFRNLFFQGNGGFTNSKLFA